MSPSKSHRPYQRRNYYIDKKFQTEFIIKYWLVVAAGSIFTIVAVYWLARNTTTVGIIGGRVAVHTTAEYLLPLMLQTVAIELVAVSLLTIVMTLFISHKIAGPLYHLKMTFHKLGGGDPTGVRLRQGDQLQEIASSYNEAMQKMSDKVKTLNNASSMDEVKKILATFKVL